MRLQIIGFYLLATLALCNGLKILVYQTVFTQSHLAYSNAIVDTLVDRGHLVDKLVMAWNSSIVSNGTSRARKVITVRSSAIKDKSPSKIDVFGNVRVRLTDDSLASTKNTFCSALVDQTTLLDQLRLEKYDVGLTSLFDYCGLGVFHLSGIKSVHGFSPSQSIDGLPQLLGVPTPPSYVTDILDPTVMTDRLSFIERVWNFIDSIRKHFEAEKFFDAQQQIFDDRFKRFPRLIDLFKGMTYVFVNADEVLGIPKPSSPKIKHIGGIAVAEPKKLPRLFERILNIPSKGVVLFSFGSYARTDGLTLRAKRKIANALAKFRDYTFIWKYDNPEEDAAYYQNYTNIFRVRWMPQNDLLHDSRVRLFITHAGINSYLESAHAGVPLVSIPLYGDQPYNAGCALRNGMGIIIRKTNMTERSFGDALQRMLTEIDYSEKAREIARMLQMRPVKPRETLFRHVEYAAEFPSLQEHLQLASANMGLAKYLCVDVILFLLVLSAVVLATAFVVLRGIFHAIRSRFTNFIKDKYE